MPRPERPLDPAAGPVQAFAADLRKLRQEAGNPKYLQMQRLTGRSRTSLAEAAGGDHLATWETVEAYVRACGGGLAEWERRWADVRDALRAERGESAVPAASPHRFRTPLWVIAAAACAAAVAVLTAYLFSGSPAAAKRGARQGPAVIVIQNKVATGPTALTEDTTPVYLSSKLIPFCSREDCEVPGTRMWSGVILQALCKVHGAEMTNEDLQSAGISRNKGGVISSLWYRAETSNGTTGYVPEVYLTPASRGGLGLPTCLP